MQSLVGSSCALGMHRAMAGSLFYRGVTEICRVEAASSGITPETLSYVSDSLSVIVPLPKAAFCTPI